MVDPYDTVILAGGEAARMGSVDKPALEVADRTLLERVADAAAGTTRTIVVGPPRDRPAARYVREEPSGGGPVPALRAGLAHVTAPWVTLLAGDLPFLGSAHVAALRRVAGGRAGAVLLDGRGKRQWLVSVWHAATLRAALGSYSGNSLHGLLMPLDAATLSLPETEIWAAFDCDTPEELAEARRHGASQSERRRGDGP
nr:molybdenum cofactor guanylyltransferase [Haloactinospora alba]